MARTIAEIERAIDDKKKMLEKTVKDAPKVKKEAMELATQKEDLDDKIKREKDKKKKETLEKERDGVIDKFKTVKLRQSTMESAEETIQAAIIKLETELETTLEGIEKYGAARRKGLAMLEREGKQLKVFWDKARQKAADAEECSRLAESSTQKGDVNTAQGAKNNARNALMAAIEAQRAADSLIKAVTTEMTKTQRNLKAKDFDVTDKDVAVHNDLTKQVQDDFKALEHMAGECRQFVQDAERAAEEAAEFADAAEVGQALYEKILDKAMKDGQEGIKSLQNTMGQKWGGYITARGELFTRLLSTLNDPSMRGVAEKAVEQGQTYLLTTKTLVDEQVKAIIASSNKATQRVPPEFKSALKPKIDRLNMLGIQVLNFHKKVGENYAATRQEFDKLQKAVTG